LSTQLPSGERLTLREKTTYPREGNVEITVDLSAPQRFVLRLRLPHWSARTSVKVKGEKVPATSGSYLAVGRDWQDGDKIEVTLDMSPHFWVGEQQCQGKTSIYHGPVLLAYDHRFNPKPFDQLPAFRASQVPLESAESSQPPVPWLLLKVGAPNQEPIHLCDFASAGATGTKYHTWLPVEGAKPVDFSRKNPLRSARSEP
jgi:hypothetical protein